MNNFKVFTQPFNWFMGFLLVAFMSGCNGSSGNGSVIADITAPTVISIAPADLASSIAINTNITATFSEAMNASTINSTTFTVKLGSTPVAGAVTYVGTTAIFKPTSVLIRPQLPPGSRIWQAMHWLQPKPGPLLQIQL
jgi:hypothetical protein